MYANEIDMKPFDTMRDNIRFGNYKWQEPTRLVDGRGFRLEQFLYWAAKLDDVTEIYDFSKYEAELKQLKSEIIAKNESFETDRANKIAQFRIDLEEAYGMTGHSKADQLFEKASQGYEIEFEDTLDAYHDLVSLIF